MILNGHSVVSETASSKYLISDSFVDYNGYSISSKGFLPTVGHLILSDQCKQMEENNRMGKTKDLFKKVRDTEGTFHAKMGTIKDRNCMDLTEPEDSKKR